MSEEVNHLRALLHDALKVDESLMLDGPMSWLEQKELKPADQIAIAADEKKRFEYAKLDADLELERWHHLESWRTYSLRLRYHAFWHAWNLVLDPPKKLDPILTRWTMPMLPLKAMLWKDSPDRIAQSVRVGMSRLEYLGIPPKPLAAVVPGSRGRGQ